MVSYVLRFRCGYTMPVASDRVLDKEIIDHSEPCFWCGGMHSGNAAVRDGIEQLLNRTEDAEASVSKKSAEGKGRAGKEVVSFKDYLASLKN